MRIAAVVLFGVLTLASVAGCAPTASSTPLRAGAGPSATATATLAPTATATRTVTATPHPPTVAPTAAPTETRTPLPSSIDVATIPAGYQQVVAPTSLLFANGDQSGYDHASPASPRAVFPFNPAEEVRLDITATDADRSASSGFVLGVPQAGRFHGQIGILYQGGLWKVYDYGAQRTLAQIEGDDATSPHLARVIGFSPDGSSLTLTDAAGNVQIVSLSAPLARTGDSVGVSVQAAYQSKVDGMVSVDAPKDVANQLEASKTLTPAPDILSTNKNFPPDVQIQIVNDPDISYVNVNTQSFPIYDEQTHTKLVDTHYHPWVVLTSAHYDVDGNIIATVNYYDQSTNKFYPNRLVKITPDKNNVYRTKDGTTYTFQDISKGTILEFNFSADQFIKFLIGDVLPKSK